MYQLLLKQLWHTPLANAPGQEIVCRDYLRFKFQSSDLSETAPILTLAQLSGESSNAQNAVTEESLMARCSAGQAIPLMDLQIVDDAMQPQIHDEQSSGEVARAPWLTRDTTIVLKQVQHPGKMIICHAGI